MKILLDSEHTLEFDKVIDFISSNCVSELGKFRLKNSHPIDEETKLTKTLKEVSEAKELYISEGGIPIWSFDDIRPLLNKIEPLDSFLEITYCQKVQNFLEVSASVNTFFEKKEEYSDEIKKYSEGDHDQGNGQVAEKLKQMRRDGRNGSVGKVEQYTSDQGPDGRSKQKFSDQQRPPGA